MGFDVNFARDANTDEARFDPIANLADQSRDRIAVSTNVLARNIGDEFLIPMRCPVQDQTVFVIMRGSTVMLGAKNQT